MQLEDADDFQFYEECNRANVNMESEVAEKVTDDDSGMENETENEEFFIDSNIALSHLHKRKSRRKFVVAFSALIISSTFLVIDLPVYIQTANFKSDVYSILLCQSFNTALIFGLIVLFMRRLRPENVNFNISELPLPFKNIIIIASLYVVSSMLIVFGMDRNKVICHIQDPIKGVVLIFALVNYFFFCRKIMGFQRIFSSTTIVVGLFISVDYALCDEFRCRGYIREKKSDDAGLWNLRQHAIWLLLYIGGLLICATYFTALECHLVPSQTELYYSRITSRVLTTISRLISSTDPSTRPLVGSSYRSPNPIHLAFWIHFMGTSIIAALFWAELLPTVGKGTTMAENWSHKLEGFRCQYFLAPQSTCGYVGYAALTFISAHVVFSWSTVAFVQITHSAVFTVATSTAALPLAGIWWSLFKTTGNPQDPIVPSPAFTGELICSFLGLPVVIVGLSLLCKSHFAEETALSRSEDF